MRKLVVATLLASLWLIPFYVSAQTATQANQMALYHVHKIYIGGIGSSDEAARFRLILEGQLKRDLA
jgi:hypothetical protein